MITLRSSLASVYFLYERFEESAHVNKELLKTTQRLFGDEHEITHICRSNLAVALKKLGRHLEANDLLTRNAEIAAGSKPAQALN